MAEAAYGLNEIPIAKVPDALSRLDNKREFIVLSGLENITYRQSTTQNQSTQSATVTYRVPNKYTVIDRHWYIRATWRVVATALAAGGNLDQSLVSGPAAYPTNRVLDQLSVNIDEVNFNSQPSRYWQALQRYYNAMGNNCDQGKFYSTCPSMPDQYIAYNDWTTFGSARNPLAEYGENSAGPTRRSIATNVAVNTATDLDVSFTSTEPLFISPLLFGESSYNKSGLTGARNINITFTFSNVERVWSNDPVIKPYTSITVTLQNLEVLIRYGDLKLSEAEKIQNSLGQLHNIDWDYSGINAYQQNIAAVPAGVPTQITSGNIQLNGIPSRLYIYAQRPLANINNTTPDSFCRITALTIQWNSRNGILSTATEQDLYVMSVRNGLTMSFAQWSRFCGSVCCVDIAKDLGLNSIQAPGVIQDNQLQVFATVTNLYGAPSDIVLYVTTTTPGVFSLRNGAFYQQIGVLSPENVLNAPYKHDSLEGLIDTDNPFGGSLKSFFKGIGQKLKKALPYLKGAVNIGSRIGEAVAPEFIPEIEAAKGIARGVLGSGRKRGGAISGGRQMSARAMNSLLKNL
jgi:hypothetical protein